MKHKKFLYVGIITVACSPLACGVEDLVMGSANTNPTRAIVGSNAEVTFRLFNNTASAIDFTLTPQGNSTPVSGAASPIPGGVGPVPQTLQPYSFNANTSGVAGSTITTGLTATEVLPGVRTASATHDIHLLENRSINFSLSSGSKTSVGGVLDLGRHIGAYNRNYFNAGSNNYSSSPTYGYGNSIALSISGGAQDHNLAADVTYQPTAMSGFSYNWGRNLTSTGGSSGLYLSSYSSANSASFTFDSANETTTANLAHYRSGQFSDTYNFGSAANLGTAFQKESGVAGAAVSFGNSVTIAGTSLANRFVTATSSVSGGAESNRVNEDYSYTYTSNGGYGYYGHPSTEALAGKLDSDAGIAGIQNRVMLGSSGNITAGSETWTIASPGGSNNFAQVNFTGTGVVTKGAVAVDTGSGVTSFDGTTTRNIAANWGAQSFGTTAGSNIDTSSAGYKSTIIDLTSNLSSGEVGGPLVGQQLGSLSVGYSLEVVRDRSLQVANVHETAFSGAGQVILSGVLVGDSGHVTNPTAHLQPFQSGSSGSSQIFSSSTNVINDDFNAGSGTGSGSRTVNITPEGLAGERAAYDLTYNWSLSRVNQATMQEGGSLASVGSGTTFLSTTRTNETGLSGSVGTFQWNQTNGGSAAKAVVNAWSSLGDGWSANASGLGTSNASFNFVFDDTGLSNGTYFGYYETVASHATLASGKSIIGSSYGDLGYNAFWMEGVVTGREDTTAYQGFRLDNFQATAPPEVSAVVEGKSGEFRILDIVDNSSGGGVSMQVLSNLGSVGSGDSELSFVSGSIKGLDGITFVLESTYDETDMIQLFGSEELAVLLWEKSTGVFVNAVLGNYGNAVDAAIDPLTGEPYDAKLGQRFVGSYEAYLLANTLSLGSPQLGDYGYDPLNNTVWAVIDHNSTFGGGISAIPEPSAMLLAFGGCVATLLRRKRN